MLPSIQWFKEATWNSDTFSGLLRIRHAAKGKLMNGNNSFFKKSAKKMEIQFFLLSRITGYCLYIFYSHLSQPLPIQANFLRGSM
jgi:hypothetical protein